MKRILLTLVLFVFGFTVKAQQVSFDYGRAWEQVYRLELQGLPKSASQKVDSIYTATIQDDNAEQRIKSVIYQSKFLLLTSDQDVSAVVANFKKEIAVNSQPVTNLLESLLAKLYLDYYQENRWTINRRTRLEKPEEDFRLWDQRTFITRITAHFEASLDLDKLLLSTPIAIFDDILNQEEGTRHYRPLLYDLLAHNAIKGIELLELWQTSNTDRDYLNDPEFLQLPAAFVKVDIVSRDSSMLLLKVLKAYQDLSLVHQSDTIPYAKVSLALERLKFIYSKTNSSQVDQLYLETLEKLKASYLGHEVSALIDFARANALHTQSARYSQNPDVQFKAAAAKIICEAAIAAFPESLGAEQCQSLLDIILRPSLDMRIEEYVLPEEPSKIHVTYRNYEQLHFKTYQMSHTEYLVFDKIEKDSTKLAIIQAHKLANEWTVSLTNENDYQEHSTEALFVPHQLDQYLLVVRNSQSPEQIVAHAFIQVTRLAIIKTQSESQQEYMVVSRENGAPLPGVTATFSPSSYRNDSGEQPPEISRTTDEQGEIRFINNSLNSWVDISLSLADDRVTIKSNYLNLQRGEQPAQPEKYQPRINFFTDRTIYRPGQQLFFKAILTKRWATRSEVYPNKELWVMLYDTNDEFLDSAQVTTNEFGSVAGEFTLPKRGITGEYYLEIDQHEYGSHVGNSDDIQATHYFSVEEYKRPKFEIGFESVNQLYTVNDSVNIKGTVTSFAGSNLTAARVKYQVSRTVDFRHLDWRSRPRYSRAEVLIAEGELSTDSQGSFNVPFLAESDASFQQKDKPVFNYSVSVDVVDINGETRSNSTNVSVGYHKYEVAIVTSELNKYEKNLPFRVLVNSLNGVAQGVNGKLRIFKKSVPNQVKRKALWPAPEYPGFSESKHNQLFPHLPYQYRDEAETRGELYYDRIVEVRNNEPVFIGSGQSWPAGSYEAEFVIISPSGDATPRTKNFELKDPKARHLPDNQLFDLSIDKAVYRTGEKVKVRYGSASKDLYVTVWVEKGGKIVKKFTSHLNNEVKTFEIPVLKSDEGGFGIYYHFTAYNSFESGQVKANVIYEAPSLSLEVGTFRNKLQPGNEEEWTFRIKGKNRRRVTAEVLASMYDASLDQFSANRWAFQPFNRRGYYLYNSVDQQRSFSIINFQQRYYPYPNLQSDLSFDQLAWFGLSVSNTKRANQDYLSGLRWRKAPYPIVFSSKEALKEGMISGRILDEAGLPMVGVSLMIDEQESGTTDLEGKFEIKAGKGQNLLLRFLGYKTFQVLLGEDNHFQILMIPDDTDLGEVVVLGNGTTLKRDITGSISTVAVEQLNVEEIVFSAVASEEEVGELFLAYDNAGIPGSASSVGLRGKSSLGADGRLIIVDGVVMMADSINTDDIASAKALSSSQAKALYGERGANGVIIITTKKALEAQNALLAQVKTRMNLKETAFFFPQIKTDRKGRFSFHFKSPESLTKWNFQLMAHDKQLASIISRRTVVTQKELMLLPNPPRFFREGDKITFSAKVASLSSSEMKGFAKLELYNEMTGELLTGVISEEGNKSFELPPNGNTNLSWQLSIPEGVQAIRYKIVAATDRFSDGEENVLPVLSNRMLVQESVPLWAAANTTKTFSLDKLKTQQSTTLKHHSLTLTMTTNPVWEAIQSLPYLMEYPYECAEQSFARYYANSLGSHIVESFPVIKETFDKWAATGAPINRLEQNQELKALLIEETPWLRDVKTLAEQQKRLAMLFESARMKEQLEASLDKLRKMQLGSGGFPWFSGSDRANLYITQHIVSGLAHLQKLTGNEDFTDILSKGLAFMDHSLMREHKRLMTRKDLKIGSELIGFSQVQYLYVRSLVEGASQSEELTKATAYFEKEAFTHWLEMDLQSQAMIAIYAKKTGNDEKAMQIINSLKEYSINDPERGIYWKSNTSGWYNWEAPIETQALLIEAFLEITDDQVFHNGMTQWLLSEKRTKSWKSTKATTEAIYALLHGSGGPAPNTSVNVSLGGKRVMEGNTSEGEAGPGYLKKSWQATEIKSEMAEVVVENNGSTIAFGGLHWQYFEDLDKITPAMGPLSLEKQLFKVTGAASDEVLKAIDENTQLALGDLVRVRIVLRSDRSMEFIHLKDMRAAGFEPLNVLSGYNWQDGLGYYESTRDAATNFFIEYLPKGTFVFEYDLRVNNEGDFSNGITSIQNMYAPEFSSHSEGVRVKIGN